MGDRTHHLPAPFPSWDPGKRQSPSGGLSFPRILALSRWVICLLRDQAVPEFRQKSSVPTVYSSTLPLTVGSGPTGSQHRPCQGPLKHSPIGTEVPGNELRPPLGDPSFILYPRKNSADPPSSSFSAHPLCLSLQEGKTLKNTVGPPTQPSQEVISCFMPHPFRMEQPLALFQKLPEH